MEAQAYHTKLVVSCRGYVVVVEFNGFDFTYMGAYSDWELNPTSLAFKPPNLLYVSDSRSVRTSLFKLGPSFSGPIDHAERFNAGAPSSLSQLFFDKPTLVFQIRGSRGGNHLEFNADKTRIVECNTRASTIDVWDSSATDGSLKLLKRLDAINPTRSLLDPTGRFFLVLNNRDREILVIDSEDDRYLITGNIIILDNITFEKQHIACLRNGQTNYLVVLSSSTAELFLFDLEYVNNTITMHLSALERQYTHPSEEVVAGNIEVARNQRDIYILMSHPDRPELNSIMHYAFRGAGNDARLQFMSMISTDATGLSYFKLSKDPDQRFVFATHDNVESCLVAFQRNPGTGIIETLGAVRRNDFGLTHLLEI